MSNHAATPTCAVEIRERAFGCLKSFVYATASMPFVVRAGVQQASTIAFGRAGSFATDIRYSRLRVADIGRRAS